MKLCLLRSGSSGNCTFIQHGDTKILLDAGGLSQTGYRSILAEIDERIDDIDAAIISHLHTDHFNFAAMSLFRRQDIPVWVHNRNLPVLATFTQKYQCQDMRVQSFDTESFTIGSLHITPFVVGHDARDVTCGFRLTYDGGNGMAYATDLGSFPDELLPYFINTAAVVLEANHDTKLLWNNPNRPYVHKQRVASDVGHLSNEQAAKALLKICAASQKHPQHIVLSHLSKDHNSADMAHDYIHNALSTCGYAGSIFSAARNAKTPFFEC
jgi:phosphoribosyl 1,2-cyclic phosphodiesterase